MQHALLGLAIAFILAIAAALAAPAIVDWNMWRASFETRATQLAGVPVRIRGRIDATILPTPTFSLRHVEVGDPDAATGLRVGEVRGVLSLGALLRGKIAAEEFTLAQPALRLAIEADGSLVPPAGIADAAAIGLMAFSHIEVAKGSLVVEDRASGALVIFDDIHATGELYSREGPLRLEGRLRRDGRAWTLRANAARIGGNGAGRLRLAVERPDDGTLFDADGMLALDAAPAFEGRVSLARRAAPGLPWQVAAQAKAGADLVSLEGIELTLGVDEVPIELSGHVRFAPVRGGSIDASLSARRLDLDRALGPGAAQGLPSVLASLREAASLLEQIPLAGSIGISADALLAGGGTLRDLRAEFRLREHSLALQRLAARLPGSGSVTAAGNGSDEAMFSGDVTLAAEDGGSFVRWAMGEAAAAAVEPGVPLRLAGTAEWTADRLAVEQLDFAVGAARLGGSFAVVPGYGARRTRVETGLTADGVDLALLAPLAEAFWLGAEALELNLAFQGKDLRALGSTLARIDVKLWRSEGEIAIERLQLDGFDGLSATAQGRIAGEADRPQGKIEFEVEAVQPGGLAAVTRALYGDEAALVMQQIASVGLPLRLSGAASGEGAAAGVSIAASGNLAGMKANIEANLDTQTDALAEAIVILQAPDQAALVSLFGIAPGRSAPGEAQLELIASAVREGALPVKLQLTGPGTSLAAQGEIRRTAAGRLEPALELRLATTDLRTLLAAAAQASNEALEAAAGARLVRTEAGLIFEDIDGEFGGARVQGRLAVKGIDRPELSGKLALDRGNLVRLLALALGGSSGGDAFWPAEPLGPPPLADATGTLDLTLDKLDIAGDFAADDAAFRLVLGAGSVAIEDFTGTFAGGRLAGDARFIRTGTLAFDGRATLNAFDLARLFPPAALPPPLRGRGNLALTLVGNGPTPAALAASLAGQGKLDLSDFEIDDLDPDAVAAVFAAGESEGPTDEIGVIAALAPALARRPLRIDALAAPLIVAAGVARTGTARTAAGPVQVHTQASLDMARLALDASVEFALPPAEGSEAEPGATVRWRGPLAAIERGIEAGALATAITTRAMEREQQRIERREQPPREEPERPSPAAAPDRAEPGRAAAPLSPDEAEPEMPPASLPTAAIPSAPAPNGPVPLPPERPHAAAPAPVLALPPLPPPVEIGPVPGATR